MTGTEAAAEGGEPVVEAEFVAALQPRSVLDAGCGTGRVASALARRGIIVAGVDINPRQLGQARKRAPHLSWHLADLATVRLPRRFDVVLLAGNVLIFLATPGSEAAVVQNMARHLAPGGALVAGFQLSPGYLTLDAYDRLAGAAALRLAARYRSWAGEPWTPASTYVISVHQRS